MDLSHPCDQIANAPRRVHMSKCKFSYQGIPYQVVITKVKSHNNLNICFGDLHSNGEFSKKIVIKAYETAYANFNPNVYDGLIEEIDTHSKIENKIGCSNYFSHMLFHYYTDTCIGIIFDDFGITLDKTDLTRYSPKTKVLMCLQLINQINFLQSNDIYHGDLKPANICVRPNGEAILIDFGIAYLKEFYCVPKLKTKYNTTINSGSPEYLSIYLEFRAGKEYPKELFDKSQHYAVGGLVFGILINNPGLYFSKCLKIINGLKLPYENIDNLNLISRFKYFNEQFSKEICEFIGEELDKIPELNSFKPILLNMFEYDYQKRLNLDLIAEQIEQIDILN